MLKISTIRTHKGSLSHPQKGFTLIELLVVVAIVSLLSSVVLASVNTARHKSYDAFRKQTVASIQKALELYYADHNKYPFGTAYSAWQGRSTSCGLNWRNCDNNHGNPMQELVDGGYLPANLPIDPENHEDYLPNGYPNAVGFYYCSGSPRGNCPPFASDQTYTIGANLEFTGSSPATGPYGNYTLNNPG